MNIGSYISLGIYGFVLVSVLLGMLFGLKRGLFRTLVRIITIIAAALVTLLLILWIFNSIDGWFAGKTLPDLIRSVWAEYDTALDQGTRSLIESFDAVTAERIIMTVFALVVVPVIYIGVFYILKALSMILYAIFAGILGFVGKRKSLASRLLGALAGAVQGALVAAIVLLPVSGMCGMAQELREPLTAKDKPEASVAAVEGFYTSCLDGVISNPAIVAVRALGGDFVYGQMAMITVGGEPVDMREQAKSIAEIYVDAMPLTGLDWKALTAENKNAMISILADVGDNEYTASIVAGLLRGVAKSFRNDALPIAIDEPFDDFAEEFISVFETSDEENITSDLRTFLNVYFILSDSRLLAKFESGGTGVTDDVKDLLIAKSDAGDTVIDSVINELQSNPRTAPIVTSLTKFSLKLMAEASGNTLPADVDIDRLYTDVKSGISNVLTDVNNPDLAPDEKKAAVKSTLNDALIESGVVTAEQPLDDEIMNSLAEHVITDFEGKDELTDEDINNAILAYYDAYAKQQSGGSDIPLE